MSDTRHTPGPWGRVWTHTTHAAPEGESTTETGRIVADGDAVIAHLEMTGNVDADAALIAAAPELLEALQLVLDFHSEDTVAFVAKYGTGIGTRVLCDRVRAAMAKAVQP